jgi:hypothetical protein
MTTTQLTTIEAHLLCLIAQWPCGPLNSNSQSEVHEAVGDPQWNTADGWEACVPRDLQRCWDQLSLETRLALALVASDTAGDGRSPLDMYY